MAKEEEVSNKILTIPNLISFIRLLMVPLFLYLLLTGHDRLAVLVFSVAAATDFVDGQIARRTHCVTKLGQLLDPTVDRALMISGVIGLLIVGRLPLWVVVFVVGRDLFLLIGGAHLLKRYKKRVPVIYPGKFATTFLFVGFAGLLLNWPTLQGLGVVSVSWLPGLNAAAYSWGIWFVYAGLLLSAFVTAYYVIKGVRLRSEALREEAQQNQSDKEE